MIEFLPDENKDNFLGKQKKPQSFSSFPQLSKSDLDEAAAAPAAAK